MYVKYQHILKVLIDYNFIILLDYIYHVYRFEETFNSIEQQPAIIGYQYVRHLEQFPR